MSLFVLILISTSSFANSKINRNLKFASSFLGLKSQLRFGNDISNNDEFISELGFSNGNQNEEDEQEENEDNAGLFDMEENRPRQNERSNSFFKIFFNFH